MDIEFARLFSTLLTEIAQSEQGKKIIGNMNDSFGKSMLSGLDKAFVLAKDLKIDPKIDGRSLPISFFNFLEESFEISLLNRDKKMINSKATKVWDLDNSNLADFIARLIQLQTHISMAADDKKALIRKQAIPAMKDYIHNHHDEFLDAFLANLWQTIEAYEKKSNDLPSFAELSSYAVDMTSKFVAKKDRQEKLLDNISTLNEHRRKKHIDKYKNMEYQSFVNNFQQFKKPFISNFQPFKNPLEQALDELNQIDTSSFDQIELEEHRLKKQFFIEQIQADLKRNSDLMQRIFR